MNSFSVCKSVDCKHNKTMECTRPFMSIGEDGKCEWLEIEQRCHHCGDLLINQIEVKNKLCSSCQNDLSIASEVSSYEER